MSAHKRKCWDCGNVALHDDSVVPHVLCKHCGSHDTRRLRESPQSTSNMRSELTDQHLRNFRFDNCYGNNFFCHEFIKGSFKIIEPSEFNAFRTFIYYRDDLPVAFIRTKQEFDELIGKLASLDRPVRAKA